MEKEKQQSIEGLERFIEHIQESIKTIENQYIIDNDELPWGKEGRYSLIASRLDSVCALLSITLFHLNQSKNEKS